MSDFSCRFAVASFLFSTSLAGGLTPVFADDEAPAKSWQDRDVEEIEVIDDARAAAAISAMKTPTPLVDVPQSLSVVSAQQIQDQVFLNIGDILRYTPGASIGQGEGHRDQFTIRGQNTTADFFVNGMRDDVQYFRPLYNLERVEILRGSNALIFGRGGGGGVINRVTKRPVLDRVFTAANASVDTFGSASIAADLNLSTGENSAFRINAFYEHLNNHRDFYEGDRFAVNPTWATLLGEDTKLLLSYEYVNDDRVVDRGVPAENNSPIRGFDNTFFGDPGANFTELEAHIAFARVDHQFNETFSVNATLQYADYDKIYQNVYPIGFDSVAGTTSLDGYRDPTTRENLLAQVNFLGEFEGLAGWSHKVVFGAEFADQASENARQDVLFADSNDDQITFAFTDPLNIPAFSFPVDTRNRASDVQVFSLFLQDQIEVTNWLQLVGGVRYDRFEIDVNDRIANADLARTDTEWSPRLGVILKPQDDLSFYASYSRSFLPRSGDQFLTLTPSTEALGPEVFDNYELGVKWDATDALSITAAIFQLDREGGTAVDPRDPENTIIIGSRTQGFEVQITGELLPDWHVTAGYSFLDADERGRVVDGQFANRRLSQVPEHMLSLWNRVDITEKLGLGLGLTYQDSQFANISNTTNLPDFIRVDAAVFYQLTDSVNLQLNVENLFDEDYFPDAHNNNNISTGEPLNARFSISARF